MVGALHHKAANAYKSQENSMSPKAAGWPEKRPIERCAMRSQNDNNQNPQPASLHPISLRNSSKR
jgi:hypothetical protein